jgi:hypothetical protein
VADVLALLSDVSLGVTVGWILWLTWVVFQIRWYRHARVAVAVVQPVRRPQRPPRRLEAAAPKTDTAPESDVASLVREAVLMFDTAEDVTRHDTPAPPQA